MYLILIPSSASSYTFARIEVGWEKSTFAILTLRPPKVATCIDLAPTRKLRPSRASEDIMVSRNTLRKLLFFFPHVPTHAPHKERDERRAAARANGIDAGATPPPGIRHKRPRRLAPAAVPRTAPTGVEHFRDLHSIWSAEGSKGTKRTSTHRSRAGTVEPPVAPSDRAIGKGCRPSQPARRGLTCDVQACGRVSRGVG